MNTLISRRPAQLPRLYRLNAAAALAGTTPELFLTACQLGQIPVTVCQIGAGGYWHVSAPELARWLGPDSSLQNLFD